MVGSAVGNESLIFQTTGRSHRTLERNLAPKSAHRIARLSRSPLVGMHPNSPEWVTFSGWYDWGYLLKLVPWPGKRAPQVSWWVPNAGVSLIGVIWCHGNSKLMNIIFRNSQSCLVFPPAYEFLNVMFPNDSWGFGCFHPVSELLGGANGEQVHVM